MKHIFIVDDDIHIGNMLEEALQREGILVFYAFMLVWIILFKMDVSVENFGQMRSINLVPFTQSVIVNNKLDVSEIIQNVLAFVPLGVLVYTIWQEKSWRFRLCCIVFTSIVLEVMQYILGVGASDITDVITNTLGGVAGLGVALGLSKLFPKSWKTVINSVSLVCGILLGALVLLLVVMN